LRYHDHSGFDKRLHLVFIILIDRGWSLCFCLRARTFLYPAFNETKPVRIAIGDSNQQPFQESVQWLFFLCFSSVKVAYGGRIWIEESDSQCLKPFDRIRLRTTAVKRFEEFVCRFESRCAAAGCVRARASIEKEQSADDGVRKSLMKGGCFGEQVASAICEIFLKVLCPRVGKTDTLNTAKINPSASVANDTSTFFAPIPPAN
jgi:hypothetical protein